MLFSEAVSFVVTPPHMICDEHANNSIIDNFVKDSSVSHLFPPFAAVGADPPPKNWSTLKVRVEPLFYSQGRYTYRENDSPQRRSSIC